MAPTINFEIMTQKEHFKLMCDKLTLEHKSVHLNKVLCSLLMWIAGGNSKALGSWKSLSRFVFRFDVSELNKTELQPLLVTFGYYPNRKDHRELMETVIKRIGKGISYIDTSKWSCHKIAFSPANILKSLNSGIFKMRGSGITLRDRIILSAWICFYLNTIDALSKVDFSNVKKYLCLANSLDLENLMTQYFSHNGIKTYSLMEGAYFRQKNELPITNIAFENLTSDIQLCWGEYSKDEFIKFGYPEERMKVIGYPKIVDGKPMKTNNLFKKSVVFLSQYVMGKQNWDLIDILSKFTDRQDFYLKLHPSLDFAAYSKIAEEKGMKIIPKDTTVNECVDNETFDFAIAINSTAYYEALMRGLPCFRYYDGTYTPMAGYNDEFSDSESYKKLLNRISTLALEDFQKEIDDTLEYAVGWGIDNYRKIFT